MTTALAAASSATDTGIRAIERRKGEKIAEREADELGWVIEIFYTVHAGDPDEGSWATIHQVALWSDKRSFLLPLTAIPDKVRERWEGELAKEADEYDQACAEALHDPCARGDAEMHARQDERGPR